jgi:hypothetical protein
MYSSPEIALSCCDERAVRHRGRAITAQCRFTRPIDWRDCFPRMRVNLTRYCTIESQEGSYASVRCESLRDSFDKGCGPLTRYSRRATLAPIAHDRYRLAGRHIPCLWRTARAYPDLRPRPSSNELGNRRTRAATRRQSPRSPCLCLRTPDRACCQFGQSRCSRGRHPRPSPAYRAQPHLQGSVMVYLRWQADPEAWP